MVIDERADLEWKRQWQQVARNREAAMRKPPWKQGTMKLCSDLPKHQATALFLLRTEVIGLNEWLVSIHVPGLSPECRCGWREQTARHVLTMCPLCTDARAEAIRRTNHEEIKQMLSRLESAQTTTGWFVQQEILRQFDMAREIEGENAEDCTLFQPLDEVEEGYPQKTEALVWVESTNKKRTGSVHHAHGGRRRVFPGKGILLGRGRYAPMDPQGDRKRELIGFNNNMFRFRCPGQRVIQ